MVNTERPGAGPWSQRQLAKDTGMSRAKMWRAMRVADLPKEEFEKLIESDNPPTVTVLAEMGRQHRDGSRPPKKKSAVATLKRAWRNATQAEQAEFVGWVNNQAGPAS